MNGNWRKNIIVEIEVYSRVYNYHSIFIEKLRLTLLIVRKLLSRHLHIQMLLKFYKQIANC